MKIENAVNAAIDILLHEKKNDKYKVVVTKTKKLRTLEIEQFLFIEQDPNKDTTLAKMSATDHLVFHIKDTKVDKLVGIIVDDEWRFYNGSPLKAEELFEERTNEEGKTNKKRKVTEKKGTISKDSKEDEIEEDKTIDTTKELSLKEIEELMKDIPIEYKIIGVEEKDIPDKYKHTIRMYKELMELS